MSFARYLFLQTLLFLLTLCGQSLFRPIDRNTNIVKAIAACINSIVKLLAVRRN